MKILWLWWPGMSTQMVSFQLLNKLAFKSNFVVISWAYLETTDDINKYILSRKDSTNVLGTHACQCHGTFAIIGLFTCVYNHIFTVLDDRDVYTLQKPLPIASLIRYILRIKIIIYKMFWETEDVILDHKEWNSNRGDAFKIGSVCNVGSVTHAICTTSSITNDVPFESPLRSKHSKSILQ